MIETGILIGVLLVWICYSGFEGFREAHYWFYRTAYPDFEKIKHMDQHKEFMFQRGIVLGLISVIVSMTTQSWLIVGLIFIANALIFSFHHNGMMYLVRKELSEEITPEQPNPYPKGWFSQSSTSQAKMTFLMGPTSRTIQMIIGICMYIYVIFTYLLV